MFKLKGHKGITLIALVITILFRYDENKKCSNSKGFLQQTNLKNLTFSHI